MSFVKSVLYGYEESYNICGTPVDFENKPPFNSHRISFEGAGVISKMAIKCLKSTAFRLATQAYAHVFVHEICHAMIYKLFAHQNAEVHITKCGCEGRTSYPSAVNANWKSTIIDLSGPMGNIAFSTCKLVAATALKSYLTWPIALALGAGAVMWISGELLFAYISVSKNSEADFANIARRGNNHLALASIALVSQVALGIFAAIKFAA